MLDLEEFAEATRRARCLKDLGHLIFLVGREEGGVPPTLTHSQQELNAVTEVLFQHAAVAVTDAVERPGQEGLSALETHSVVVFQRLPVDAGCRALNADPALVAVPFLNSAIVALVDV